MPQFGREQFVNGFDPALIPHFLEPASHDLHIFFSGRRPRSCGLIFGRHTLAREKGSGKRNYIGVRSQQKGPVRVFREDDQHRRREGPLSGQPDRESPPFAKNAKDGPP
jgi:hypothetical protein